MTSLDSANSILEEQCRAMRAAEGENDWQVSLHLTLPLHQNGRRKSEIARGSYPLHRLQLQK